MRDILEYIKVCGRSSEDIKILAATKNQSCNIIKVALENGINYIAESRVQEAEQKIPELTGLYKEFHFIGHLQSNKISKLIALNPTLIHSIDKYSTVIKLNEYLKRISRKQDILVEVNTSNEMQKNGVSLKHLPELLKSIDDLEFVNVLGLMTIGALGTDQSITRRCFKSLKESFETEKCKRYTTTRMKYLSMGMSNDYKIAIEEGANILRLGSIIFGEREKKDIKNE